MNIKDLMKLRLASKLEEEIKSLGVKIKKYKS